MAQVSESDYRTAQMGDARVRQEFIEAIDLGERKFEDIGLVYRSKDVTIPLCHCQDKNRFPVLMRARYSFFPDTLDIFSREVYIFPRAYTKNLADFLNTLTLHELHHLRQIGLKKVRRLNVRLVESGQTEYLHLLLDLPAYLNQLTDQNIFSSPTESRCAEIVDLIEKKLRKLARVQKRDWKSDLAGILCPSPHDNIVRDLYSLE